MERLSRSGQQFPRECFTCPAKTFFDGEYYCNPMNLDDKKLILKVARYKPDRCPLNPIPGNQEISPEILLRKILRK